MLTRQQVKQSFSVPLEYVCTGDTIISIRGVPSWKLLVVINNQVGHDTYCVDYITEDNKLRKFIGRFNYDMTIMKRCQWCMLNNYTTCKECKRNLIQRLEKVPNNLTSIKIDDDTSE